MTEQPQKRCGTCHWTELVPQDFTARICYGAPPVPSFVPAGPGQVTMRMVRPIVKIAERACSQYQAKDEADTARELIGMQVADAMKTAGQETKQ